MSKVELLAPVGNINALKPVIYNGADAIYLGLDKYNARMNAENFTIDNIRNIIEFAHLYNVKVYVTINIVLKDEEITDFINLIDLCIAAKVDAFIVQDIGVAYFLKKHYKNICLHASTQMGIHNYLGAKVLEEIGFKRIILSRETTLDDIKYIHKHTNLEIEFFVQGALCVGFSGNCYMSSFLANESGNRGRCKQFCRQKYQIIEDNRVIKNGYYLSSRDLCLANELQELINAGVTCFKIEGRMRREGYAALVVQTYRKLIDENFRKIKEEEKNILRIAFSRGDFNYYAYLNGLQSGIINEDIPNHLGLKVGKVLQIKPFKKGLYELEIFSRHDLFKGDGLKFINGEKEVASLGVGNVIKKAQNIYKIFTKQKISGKNLDVYLTLNKQKESEVLSYSKKLMVTAKVCAKENQNLTISLECRNSLITYTSSFICKKANNVITNCEEIATQINKLNNSEFALKHLCIDADHVFLPKSILNDLRREAFKLLKVSLISDYEKKLNVPKIDHNEEINLPEFQSYGQSLIINEEVDIERIDKSFKGLIIYSPKIFYAELSSKLKFLQQYFSNAKIALNLPIIALRMDLEIIDKIIKNSGEILLVANNLYGLYYRKNHEVIASHNLNICNALAIKFYKEFGIKNVVASLETNKDFLVNNPDIYYYAFGYNTLMNYVHCPFKSIYKNECRNCTYSDKVSFADLSCKDIFPLRRIKLSKCYFELLNSKAINTFKKANNAVIIDLRNVKNISKALNMLEETCPKKVEDKETLGMFFKQLN